MFDDPKKRLDELNRALMEAEAPEVEAPEEDWLQVAKDFLAEMEGKSQAPIRNKANDYGRKMGPTDMPRTKYADEEMSESDALYVERPRRKGAGGLVILALLELITIALIILWWMKWTL